MAHKKQKPLPQIKTKTIRTLKQTGPVPRTSSLAAPSRSTPKPITNGLRNKETTPRSSSTPVPSRPASKEPLERLKKARQLKRSSPASSTPHFSSSDEDEEEDVQPNKRARLAASRVIDPDRRIRDHSAFVDGDDTVLDMIHAADIANSTIIEHSRDKYEAFFTALMGDEDECPTIELQYPSASQREKYQLVKPRDHSDFRPIGEIIENMRVVAEYYLGKDDALKVVNEDFQNISDKSIINRLHSAFNDGLKGRVGAQSRFVNIVDEYNSLIAKRQRDGSIAQRLDAMAAIDLKLVQHIIKEQIYARAVSPQVHIVRQYEGFSDNVYGELLPMFLSRIFKETRLKSKQVFVDLGSGVGNCVLQAALETGCESWGCEMMDNPHKLAELQAQEFPARCRLWGIKPGPIKLIHDDFLKNEEIGEVLKRADVVLINNQAFNPELNDKLKYKFLDLKEGAQIVSLKYFRDPQYRIKESNMENPVNVLTVKEMERFSGMVSWSHDPGKWYMHKKDTRELEAFNKRLMNGHT